MSNYTTPEEFAKILNLPRCDNLLPHTFFNTSAHIILDEVDNIDLINYCNENDIYYYIMVDKDGKMLISVVFIDQYSILKKEFPDIKEIGVSHEFNTEFISHEHINDYIATIGINNDRTVIRFVDGVSSDILKFFSYSYYTDQLRHGELCDTCVMIPDRDSYNKLVLFLGGRDRFILYRLSRIF